MIVALLLTLLFLPAPARAEVPTNHIYPFETPSARAAALGGTHAALTDDYYTAFNNPAGFAAIPQKIRFAELSAEMDHIDFLMSLYFGDVTVQSFRQMIMKPSEAYALIGGPISFGMISNGWGWRVFNATRANIYWNGVTQRFMDARYSEELALNIGHGFRLMRTDRATLDVGITLKGFYRLVFLPERTTNTIDDLITAMQEARNVFSTMGDHPWETQIGGGIDIGIRWTWDDSFSLGLACKDPYSPAAVTGYRNLTQYSSMVANRSEYKTVAPKLGAGLSWRIPSQKLHRFNTDLILSVDYNNFLDPILSSRSPLLPISVGLELRILEVLSLRAGFADLLPSGGLGVNFTYFQFDAAYGGKEISATPGSDTTWFLSLNLIFRQ
ncbi:MAG: hypothetical protein LBS82_05105 [Spirochaetaceae bacterium]|nr:hypothetical protein [Spirochaetaceae bacterium]